MRTVIVIMKTIQKQAWPGVQKTHQTGLKAGNKDIKVDKMSLKREKDDT